MHDQNPAPMKRVRIGILDHTMSLSPERDFRIVKRSKNFFHVRLGLDLQGHFVHGPDCFASLKAVARDRPHWVIGQRSHRRVEITSELSCHVRPEHLSRNVRHHRNADANRRPHDLQGVTAPKVFPIARLGDALSGRSTASRLQSRTRTYCPSLGARSATTSRVQINKAQAHLDTPTRAHADVPFWRLTSLGVV